MSTSKQFKDYVIDQLSPTGNVALKSMMGEYLFYYEGVKRFMRRIEDLSDVEFLRKVLTATKDQLTAERLKKR